MRWRNSTMPGACDDAAVTATQPWPRFVTTLPELFAWRVRETPAGEAYRAFDPALGAWHSLSWAEVAAHVARWVAALARLALPGGARVAILLPNGVDAVCADQASLALGLVPVPMHALDNPQSIAYVVADSEASVLVLNTADQWADVLAVGTPLPALRLVVVAQESPQPAPPGPPGLQGVRSVLLRHWLAEPAPNPPPAAHAPRAGDLCAIVYTSGTTGKPKGVMLSHHNVLSNVRAVLERLPLLRSDRLLSFLPLSHTFERTCGYYLPMAAGSCVAYARSAAQLSEDLKTVQPTILVSVPRIYERVHAKLLQSLAESGRGKRWLFETAVAVGWRRFQRAQRLAPPGGAHAWLDTLRWPLLDRLVARPVRGAFGGRLRAAVSGGAPLSLPIAQTFIGLGLTVLQGYGMTETSPVVSANAPDDNDPASVGRALAGVELRIGADAELQVRAPSVMRGYWKRPQGTERAMTPDGWLRTGDQARIEAGRLFIIGRLKDIIVLSTGEKVSPADLEMAIAADPLFEQVMVVGDNRPYLSALVVLNRAKWAELSASRPDMGAQAQAPAWRALLLERLQASSAAFPPYAKVRALWPTLEPWTLDNGLMTPTLKLKRTALQAKFAAPLSPLYPR
jgi:long-chain acyl-CoA synthetase